MAFEDATKLFNYDLNQLQDTTYDVYKDAYGYVLGLRVNDDKDNYLFVVGYEQTSTVLAKAIDKALVIFTDGSMETVEIKDDDLSADNQDSLGLTDGNSYKNGAVNKWYTYSKDSNGVYKLKKLIENQFHEEQADFPLEVAANTKGEISGVYATLSDYKYADNGNASATKVVAVGNDKSTYITVKADTSVIAGTGSIVKVSSVTTGIKNTNIVTQNAGTTNANGAYVVYNDKGYVKYAVVVGKSSGTSDNLVYLIDGIAHEHYDDPDLGETYWVYDVIRNGEVTTIKSTTHTDNSASKNELVEGYLY
jgi:hypothetical protein